MDANTIFTAVNTLGFPIFTAIALMWYTKYQSDNNNKAIKEMREEYSKELKEIRQEHASESKELQEVLANNTKALSELTDKLDAIEHALYRRTEESTLIYPDQYLNYNKSDTDDL